MLRSCVLVILAVRQRTLAGCFSLFQTLKNSCCFVSSQTLSKMEKSARCLNQVVNSKRKMQGCLSVILAFLRYLNKMDWLTRCPPQMNFRSRKSFHVNLHKNWSHIFPEHFQACLWTKRKNSHSSFCIFSHCISEETVKFA